MALAAALAACGSSGNGASGNGGSVTLGLQLLETQLPFSQNTKAGAEAAAKDVGVRLRVNGPGTVDPNASIAQVESILSTGIDGLAVGPEPAALWNRTLREAVGRAGQVVTINNPPEAASGVTTYIGANSFDLGKASAESTISTAGLDAGTTGTVLIGTCVPESSPLQATVDGYKAAIATLLPKAKVVGPMNTTLDPTKSFSTWEQLLRANPDAVLALGSCDSDGPSMIRAKTETGGSLALGVRGSSEQVFDGVRDGIATSAVDTNWYAQGYTAVRYLAAAARGESLPKGWIDTGFTIFTKADVDEFADSAKPANVAAANKKLLDSVWAHVEAGTIRPLSDAR